MNELEIIVGVATALITCIIVLYIASVVLNHHRPAFKKPREP